jgi:hypothetical protein
MLEFNSGTISDHYCDSYLKSLLAYNKLEQPTPQHVPVVAATLMDQLAAIPVAVFNLGKKIIASIITFSLDLAERIMNV